MTPGAGPALRRGENGMETEHMPLLEGRFLRRCSRFAAEIEIGGNVEYCHVKNTGRLRELLVPGARVWCEVHDGAKRKTRCSLVLVEAAGTLVSIDSLAPNRIAFEYVRAGGLGFVPEALRREVTRGDSRFDLWFRHGESEGFLEVKGVTLMEEGTARFPDAPTERGVKHLRGLQRAAAEGCEAWVIFVIQRSDAADFRPNDASDPAFGAALREAAAHGVRVRAVRCRVTLDGMTVIGEVPVQLD